MRHDGKRGSCAISPIGRCALSNKTFWLASLLLLATTVASAQVTTGTISGTVRDTSGAVLPNASIAIKNVDTGSGRTVQSDNGGRYSAPALGLGNYEITASASGFQTAARKGVELT